MTSADPILIVTLGSEIYVKSDRTRRRFWARLIRNLEDALARDHVPAEIDTLDRGRLVVTSPELDAAAATIAETFGIHRVEYGVPIDWHDLDSLAAAAADAARHLIRGRTFAVRVKRTGEHPWGSNDANAAIGTLLLDASAGVDLDDPEVEVRVLVLDDRAWLLEREWEGPGGMPLGTQDRCLGLLSGGFDSPVAAWMLMRRGCPVDFLHVRLECAQSDHALAVGYELWRRWGAGTSPLAWVIDFTEIKAALEDRVPARLRQVVLKQLMFAAADDLAARRGIPALITGEAVGQVSSQTLHHLAEIDRMCARTVLRPLAGFEKNEIVNRAHEIGTGKLSARAHEVCDLSGSRVAIAAQRPTLDRALAGLPDDLARRAVDERHVVAIADWMPGTDAVPVVSAPPDGIPIADADDAAGVEGPVAVRGSGAAHVASRLLRDGREVWLLEESGEDTAPA